MGTSESDDEQLSVDVVDVHWFRAVQYSTSRLNLSTNPYQLNTKPKEKS